MKKPRPIGRNHALVAMLKAAYETGSSLNDIAQDFAISSSKAHNLLRKFHPSILRDQYAPEVRRRASRKHWRQNLTLESLGLHNIGPCLGCRVEILGPDRYGGRKVCSSCAAVDTYGPGYYG